VLEGDQADGAEWPPDLSSWWTPPDFESLHAAPELQEIVAAHFCNAVRWSNDRHQEHGATMQSSVGALFETRLVRGMERALARQRGRSACESPKSQSWESSSGGCVLTTSWSVPLCCETQPNTINGSPPSSRRCSDPYDVTFVIVASGSFCGARTFDKHDRTYRD
jgi:hypothetical protein